MSRKLKSGEFVIAGIATQAWFLSRNDAPRDDFCGSGFSRECHVSAKFAAEAAPTLTTSLIPPAGFI
jgi:hypothetical protein